MNTKCIVYPTYGCFSFQFEKANQQPINLFYNEVPSPMGHSFLIEKPFAKKAVVSIDSSFTIDFYNMKELDNIIELFRKKGYSFDVIEDALVPTEEYVGVKLLKHIQGITKRKAVSELYEFVK